MEITEKKEYGKIKKSTWVLAIYLVLAPLDFMPILPGFSISKFIIFIPLVTCLLYLKVMKIKFNQYLFFSILYVFMTMISIFYSYNVDDSLQRSFSVALNIGVILILSMLNYNKTEIEFLKKSVVLSGWLTLILILFYSNNSILAGRVTVVVNGIYQDPNYMSGFFIFAIVYYFSEFLFKKKKIPLVIMIIFIIFVLLTGSRGGFLAILFSLLIIILAWIISSKAKMKSFLKASSLLIIMVVLFNVALSFFPESISDRYNVEYSIQDGGAGRTAIWEDLLHHYEEFPIFHKVFGWGAGTVQHFNYKEAVAHNIWVETLIELGIIGTVILFLFYFLYLFKSFKFREYVIAAAFIGYLIMTLTMSLYSYKPIWNILFLIIILTKNNTSFFEKEKN